MTRGGGQPNPLLHQYGKRYIGIESVVALAGHPMQVLENKIPPPIVAVIFVLLMWGIAQVVPGLEISFPIRITLTLLFLMLGLSIILAGVITFNRVKTTINPLKPETASSLVTTGIYHFSRNPMYLGMAILLVAWAAYLASPAALLGVVGFVLCINQFQIAPEERAIAALFGQEFVDHQSQVRRWL
jgi:protein-S-isoprenylcysteine O-methyltransferase Ste14